MTELAFHLKLTGLGLMLLGVVHAYFPRHFQWGQELEKVSLLTRQVFWVHNFYIGVVVFGIGLMCWWQTAALLEPQPLARWLNGALALFWFSRLIFQWFVYDSRLWRGKRFETAIHVLFTGLWSYLTFVFTWAFIQ